jgi:hypothetical protein
MFSVLKTLFPSKFSSADEVPSVSSTFSKPEPVVAFACGSASTNKTLLFIAASEAHKFTAVVVFPTPPF